MVIHCKYYGITGPELRAERKSAGPITALPHPRIAMEADCGVVVVNLYLSSM